MKGAGVFTGAFVLLLKILNVTKMVAVLLENCRSKYE